MCGLAFAAAHFLLLAFQAQLLERANASYLARNSVDAVRLYQEYLANNPDRADVRVFLGAALFNLGKSEEAMAQAGLAIAIDKRYGRAYVLLGRVHASRNDWRLAQQAFSEAARLDPRDREAWYFSGRAYYEENLFEKSIEALKRVHTLGEEQARVHENLGLAYEGLGRLPAAEAAYKRAISLAGPDYRPYFAYGSFLRKQGKTEQGLSLLRKAIELNPASAETHFELAKTHLESDQVESAVRELRAAITLSDECRFRYLLSKAYSRQRRTEEAAGELKSLGSCLTDPASQQLSDPR